MKLFVEISGQESGLIILLNSSSQTEIFVIPPLKAEAVKKFRRMGRPSLLRVGDSFGIIVGHVPTRGAFEFFPSFGARGLSLFQPGQFSRQKDTPPATMATAPPCQGRI